MTVILGTDRRVEGSAFRWCSVVRLFLILAALAVLSGCAAPATAPSPRADPGGKVTADIGPGLRLWRDRRPVPGSGPWWRYVTVVGLPRLAAHPRLAPGREQARALLSDLERVSYLTCAADYLWPRLWDHLTAAQQARLRQVRLPDGTCTCPCASWNPVVSKVGSLLAVRAGPEPLPPVSLPRLFPASDRPGVPSGLQLLQGLTVLEQDPRLHLSMSQARVLLPLARAGIDALDVIEERMDSLRGHLTVEQRRWLQTHGSAWLEGRTGSELESVWERWEAAAISALRRAASRR